MREGNSSSRGNCRFPQKSKSMQGRNRPGVDQNALRNQFSMAGKGGFDGKGGKVCMSSATRLFSSLPQRLIRMQFSNLSIKNRMNLRCWGPPQMVGVPIPRLVHRENGGGSTLETLSGQYRKVNPTDVQYRRKGAILRPVLHTDGGAPSSSVRGHGFTPLNSEVDHLSPLICLYPCD